MSRLMMCGKMVIVVYCLGGTTGRTVSAKTWVTDEENPIPTEPWALRINTMVLIGLQVEGSHSLLLVRTSNKSKSICAISKRLGYGEPEKIIIRGTILDRYASQTPLKHPSNTAGGIMSSCRGWWTPQGVEGNYRRKSGDVGNVRDEGLISRNFVFN